MPLTANCQDNIRICTLDFKDAHEIKSKYNKGSLTCPFCKQIVHPRAREGTEANRNWAKSRYSVSDQLLFSEHKTVVSVPQ